MLPNKIAATSATATTKLIAKSLPKSSTGFANPFVFNSNRFYSTDKGSQESQEKSNPEDYRRMRTWYSRRGGFYKFAIGAFFIVVATRMAFPHWFEGRYQHYPRDMELYKKVISEDGIEAFELVDPRPLWGGHKRRGCHGDMNSSWNADYKDFLEFKEWKNKKDDSSFNAPSTTTE